MYYRIYNCYIFLAGRIAATNKLPYFKNSLDLVHVWLTSGFQSHTRDCFNKRYSGHWIDKREPTAWPICSSEFNLSDFFIRRQLYRLIRWNPVDSSQDLNYKLALCNPERTRGFECHVPWYIEGYTWIFFYYTKKSEKNDKIFNLERLCAMFKFSLSNVILSLSNVITDTVEARLSELTSFRMIG